jgi:hypothetical protein
LSKPLIDDYIKREVKHGSQSQTRTAPTVIKDKKIVLKVIEQIRKPISAKVIKRNEKIVDYIVMTG